MSAVVKKNPVTEFWSGTATVTKTWDNGYKQGLWIKNDGASDITVLVNGITLIIKQGDPPLDIDLQPFATLTITTTVAYRAFVRG